MTKSLHDLLRARQGDTNTSAFAKQIGLPIATLHALYNGGRGAGVATLRKIAAAFPHDQEMHAGILNYVTGNGKGA